MLSIENMKKRLRLLNDQIIPAKKSELSALQREINCLEKESVQLAKEILPKPKDRAHVSDHAVLRYLERVLGIGIDKIREEILTPERAALIEAGAKTISVSGIKFKIEGNTITTVI